MGIKCLWEFQHIDTYTVLGTGMVEMSLETYRVLKVQSELIATLKPTSGSYLGTKSVLRTCGEYDTLIALRTYHEIKFALRSCRK